MKYNKNEVTGKMRDRIILQNVNRSRSLTGFALEIWADVATIWAFAESKLPGSNETIIEGKNTAKNICDFTIRYISSITEESRVVFKNKIYQVKNIKISHDRRFISFQGVYYDSYSTVFGLQLCSASLLAQSSLSAALMRVIKYQASLNAFGSVSADISFVQKVASSLNANASLSGDISFVKNADANLSALASLTGDISFVQKVQASLLTSASVTGNLTIPKTFNASLLATGTTTADLTVNAPSASLLLDLYPNAGAAYSLRKLRTAYTGSAIRVRASTSGAEGDVSFDVNNTISANSTVTVTAVGTSGLSIGQQVTFSTFWNAGGSNQNVFVTIWYDQSGNAKNATQTTSSSQPQIVSSGSVFLQNGKATVSFNGSTHFLDCGLINGGTKPANYSFLNVSRFSSLAVTRFSFGSISSNTADTSAFNLSGVRGSKSENFFGDGVGGATISNSVINHTTNQQLNSAYYVGGNSIQMYRDGIALSVVYLTRTASSCGGTEFKTSIGKAGEASLHFIGDQQENIIYTNDQTTNRVGIETNIKSYYSIL